MLDTSYHSGALQDSVWESGLWETQESLQELRELGRAQTSDGVPSRRGDETFRATAGVCTIRYVVEYVCEQRGV